MTGPVGAGAAASRRQDRSFVRNSMVADAASRAYDATGRGITRAVIDSGIDRAIQSVRAGRRTAVTSR